MIRVANAPVSYGAFEQTVGVLPNVPAAGVVLDAIAAAGYDGTELGPHGYFGTEGALHAALERRGLELAGAFVMLDFAHRDLTPLEATLDLLEPYRAPPILSDTGPPDGAVDLEGVARAVELARARGLEPVFHHHMGTRVQTPDDIERLLDGTDVALLLDTGHLVAGGGDAVHALHAWGERVRHVHVKDVSLRVLRDAPDWGEAWRRGAFCELGAGDVDLAAFFAALVGYDGWLVVEQDWFPREGEDPQEHIAAQQRNRAWLREHARI
ncbi:MAG: TIM barrel protein [Gaiellaceae bacterium]